MAAPDFIVGGFLFLFDRLYAYAKNNNLAHEEYQRKYYYNTGTF